MPSWALPGSETANNISHSLLTTVCKAGTNLPINGRKKLIQKWIDGEAEHMAWEAQYLYHIEKLGYENFLIAMM